MARTFNLHHLLIYLLLLLGSAVMVLPFAWMLSTSLKPAREVFVYPLQWLPSTPAWENYWASLTIAPFGRFYWNSFLVATTATLMTLLFSSAAAFAFARLRFWGREQIFVLYLATLMIPGQVTLIPSFVIIRTLGWYDSYWALIIPAGFSVFSTFLLRQAFRAIPRELDEAARMDGASSWRIWWQIDLPLVKPTLATVTIFSFLGEWNSFLWPLIVTHSVAMRTVPLGLSVFQGEYSVQWNLLMAGTTLAILPVLVLYAIGQQWIVEATALSTRSSL